MTNYEGDNAFIPQIQKNMLHLAIDSFFILTVNSKGSISGRQDWGFAFNGCLPRKWPSYETVCLFEGGSYLVHRLHFVKWCYILTRSFGF